jgi:hypothetical protein
VLLRRAAFAAATVPAVLLAAMGSPAAATSRGDEALTVHLDPTRVSLAGSGYDTSTVFDAADVRVSSTAVSGDAPESAQANGSFAVVDTPLSTVTTATLVDSGTGTLPTLRLLVDFDGDGLADGTLVGDPAFADWYLTPDSLQFVKNGAPEVGPDSGSPWHGLLSDWGAAFPGATVLRAGWQLGPAATGSWTITALQLGPTAYTFTDQVPDAVILHAGDLDQALADDGPHGHIAFLADRLQVYTDNADDGAHVVQYTRAGRPTALSQFGQPSLGWQGDGAVPLLRLVVDLTGDGTDNATLTLDPATTDNWYVAAGAAPYVKHRAPSCNAGAAACSPTVTDWNGSLSGWADAFPDATVTAVGFQLGPDEKADGAVTGITAADTDYGFANTRPVARKLHVATAFGTPVVVDLAAGVTDPDPPDPRHPTRWQVLDPAHGTVDLSGSQVTYQPADGFAGSDSFVYLVDDGVTPAVHSRVYVTVAKAATRVGLRLRPVRPQHTQVLVAHIPVASAGSVDLGKVTVRVGRAIWRGTVTQGVATVRLRRFARGPHRVVARFLGTGTASAAQRAATVHVG